MGKPPGPGDPPLYLESYKIPVGKTTRFNASITLDTNVTDADVIVEIDDGDVGWTVLDSTTASFEADTAKTLFAIFGGYIYWTAAAPVGVRYFRVRIGGGTPAMTEFERQVAFEVYDSPVISTPAISAASITQDELVTITATFTNATRAWVTVIDADGAVEYSKDMTITAGAGSCTIPGRYLAAAVYAAGQIEIHAVDSTGALAALDETLALEVTTSASALLIRVAEVLQSLIQADSRFSDIEDEDIIIAAHANEVAKAMDQKSIVIIPLRQASQESTCSLDENKLFIWVASVVYDSRTDREDYQPLEDLENMMANLKQLVREQDDDPDERLSGIAQCLHATNMGDETRTLDYRAPDEFKTKGGGGMLVGYTEIVVTVLTDENGAVQ
jgi:hypothetical protein